MCGKINELLTVCLNVRGARCVSEGEPVDGRRETWIGRQKKEEGGSFFIYAASSAVLLVQ